MAHPSVAELLAGVDDEPAPALAEHLSTCVSCRRVVERARPAATAERASLPAADLGELPIVDPALYARVADAPEQRGGMGRTFVVRDRRLGREVAIKQPLGAADVADPVLRDTLRARFEREARLTARLEHPAIVAVHEAGRFPDGEAFYAMRLVSGTSLADEIARRPDLAARLELLPNLTTVAEALAYAHSRGVTHRDVKPANILLGAFGETVLIDWGLAADAETGRGEPGGAPVYRAGELPLTDYGVGTPGYMAPEQARGDAPAAKADIYALGATIYHLLAGRAPAAGRARPLAELVPEAPPPLVALVTRAMAESPAERFAGVAELAAELRRFQAGQLMISHRYSTGELVRHYLRRYRVPLAIAAIAATVLVTATVVYVQGLSASRARTEAARRAAEASDRTAQAALRRQLGVTASQLAGQPPRRLEAIVDGVRAVAPDLGGTVHPEALQGLVDALAAGPVAAPLLAHHGAIDAAAFTRDGQELLTGGADHRVRRWAVPAGKELAQVATRLERPSILAVSPDGATLLVCGYDALAELVPFDGGTARALPLPLGGARCTFTRDGDALVAAGREVRLLDRAGAVRARADLPAIVSAMVVAPDGLVALGTSGGDVLTWRPGMAPALAPQRHAGAVYVLAFLDGGARLVSGGADGRALSAPVAGDLAAAPSVLVSRPGELVATLVAIPDRHELAVQLYPDLSSPQQPTTVLLRDPAPLTITDFSPIGRADTIDGGALAGLGPDGAKLIDPSSGRTLLQLPPASERTHGALHARDSLLTFSEDGLVMLWDLRSRAATGQLLGHTGEVTALDVAGDRLWSTSLDGTVRGWSLADASPPRVFAHDSELHAAVPSPGGAAVALLGADGAVRLRARDDDATLRVLASPGAELAFAFAAWSPDGTELLTGAAGGRAQRWDAATGAARGSLVAGAGDLSAGAYAPDGRTIALGATDSQVLLVDAATGAVTATHDLTAPDGLGSSKDAIDSVRFTAAGLVVGFASARTAVLDARTLAIVADLEGRPLATLASGALVAIAADGRVLVHPPGRGAPAVLEGTGRPATAATMSSDEAQLAIADRTGKVQVWDLARQAAVLTFAPARIGVPTSLAFVDGGRALAVGGSGGALRVVPIEPALAARRGCELLAYLDRTGEVAGLCPIGVAAKP